MSTPLDTNALKDYRAFVKKYPDIAMDYQSAGAGKLMAKIATERQSGKIMADIYALARLRLAVRGVTAVYGGGFCTVTDPRFFSYRRSPRTGRFASLIWLDR